jgi:GNAT superfamily N-acetyltransferase
MGWQDEFRICDDKAEVDGEVVWQFLSTDAYWGRWRSREQVEAQIAGAWRVVGAFTLDGDHQVGFARAVSDGVGIAYLADVFVLPQHRGRGLGHALVQAMIEDGPGREFRWMLHTADAHGLYAGFGFVAPDAKAMERPGRQQTTRT